ncbi:BnaC01g32290D [Brassica napus]|uniref:(rape) hypothetical protein n=1 Tax=Brassica napus TaxID=3708 RepID=A0A078GQF3_BRANA|nr:unnamed protein product [Brassica napus]CDY27546.1 BnaC01g32290D [Brassica napus]
MTLNQSSTWPTYSYERYQIIAYKTGWIILLNALRITDSNLFFFFVNSHAKASLKKKRIHMQLKSLSISTSA